MCIKFFYYPYPFNAIIDNVPGVQFLVGHSVYVSNKKITVKNVIIRGVDLPVN